MTFHEMLSPPVYMHLILPEASKNVLVYRSIIIGFCELFLSKCYVCIQRENFTLTKYIIRK